VTGDLTLRGVTRPMVMDVTFNQAGVHPVDNKYTVGFDGRAVIKRSEFGMTYLVPALGDEVTLRLEGEFKKVD
jgi:polyisoprenoid-binding protein YceI